MKRLSPKKKWGQNFLRNRVAVNQIVEALRAESTDLILEIGPGEGALTRRLAELDCRLRLVEIDPDLATRLHSEFGNRADVVQGDAIETPLPEEPFKAVGNLPYNVATPIVRRVISDAGFSRGVFMIQKEVADRLLASPGDDAYGYLTIFRAAHASAHKLITLSPASFFPRPKVWSTVIVLEPAEPDLANGIDRVLALASRSFRLRRKTLANNLTGWRNLDKSGAEECIAAAGLAHGVRAERLSLAEFDQLESKIAERGT